MLLPRCASKIREGETAPEEFKKVAQVKGEVMPIRQPEHPQEYMEITPEMRKFSAVAAIRRARREERYVGRKKIAIERRAKRAEKKAAQKEGGKDKKKK